jgi:hypothetical protein
MNTTATTHERVNRRHETIARKRNNPAKFNNVAEMRRQLNAYKVLHNAGYDQHALRQIAHQFENSTEFAMKEITDMSSEMERMKEEE